MTDKPELENIPFQTLRKMLKDKDIKFKPTHKKVDLIKMLKDGKTIIKVREVKRAPQLEDSRTPKSLPIVPDDIKPDLERMAAKGLSWTIDEDSCCINFKRDIDTCANLDQSGRNILNTAKASFAVHDTAKPKGR